MFRFCSLYSGSTGNSLYVETPNTKILIDAGESAKKIVSALSNIEVDITEINAILVTHEHSDHIKGLGTLSKKYNIPVIVTEHSSNYYQYFKGINKEFGDYVINNSYYSTVSNYMKQKMLKPKEN